MLCNFFKEEFEEKCSFNSQYIGISFGDEFFPFSVKKLILYNKGYMKGLYN